MHPLCDLVQPVLLWEADKVFDYFIILLIKTLLFPILSVFGEHNATKNPSVGTKAMCAAPADSFVGDRDVSFSPEGEAEALGAGTRLCL